MPVFINIVHKHINPENGEIYPSIISECKNNVEIQITSQRNLQKLNLENLTDSFKILMAGGCINLTSLTNLPESTEVLNLNHCTGLVDLEISSLKNLRIINLNGCDNINWTKELESHLQLLEDEYECKVSYPKNHPKYTQKLTEIERIEMQLASLNDSTTSNLHKLFTTYLTTNSEQRETRTSINETLNLLHILNQKPEDKIWLEEIAQKFTDDESDLNKNAIGLFYVFSYLLISRQEKEEKKLEFLIPLMIYDFTAKFVKKTLELQGNYDSFHQNLLTSAALQRINQNLQKNGDIISNWVAVPRSISPKKVRTSAINTKAEMLSHFSEILRNPIQKKVDEFLTEKNIDHLLKGSTQILEEMTEENVDNFFLNKKDFLILWCKIAFPEEYKKFQTTQAESKLLTSITSNESGWFRNFEIFGNRIIDLTKKLIPKNSPSSQNANLVKDQSKRAGLV
ncbi:MAG: hypothetical protein ACJAW3_000471 [Lentimonas sp.]|jgi:hypothetical protein